MFRKLLLACVLSGCSAVVPATVAVLAKGDPLTADPGDYRFFVHLPEGLELAPGMARLEIESTYGDLHVEDSFQLRQDKTAAGTELFVDPADIPAMRRLQTTVSAWEAESPEGNSGSLSVFVGVCTSGAGPDPEAPVSISVSIRGGVVMPLMRPLPAQRYIDRIEADAGQPIGPCRVAPAD